MSILRLVPLLLLAAPAHARSSYVFEDVAIYGTNKVTAEQIRDKYKADFTRYLQRKGVKSKLVQRDAKRMRKKLVAGVKRMGDFPFIDLDEIRVKSEDGKKHILFMFEVIEKTDIARRLPLRSEPKDTVQDTSGLLAAWAKYDKTGWDLVRKNEIPVDRNECPAFYCTWGAVRPELGALQNKFTDSVSSYKDLLVQVMQQDKDPKRRAHAIYLLSYLSDGAEVSNLISYGLLDPSVEVRTAVMRVYTDMAIYHKEVPIPVHQILRLLELPYSDDRERGLALLVSIADNPDYKSFLLHKAGTPVLKLLRISHPTNKQMAHTVLTLLSGLSTPATEYDAWESWLWKARRDNVQSEIKE